VTLTIPELSLVLLVGTSGSGKSTFARKHFLPTEVISSDYCRALVSDDENCLDATMDAFDVLRYIAGKRLARGLMTVIDATNVQPESREPLIQLAYEHDVLPVAIVLDMPEEMCHERNRARTDRDFGPHVIRNQNRQLRRSLRGLQREGFRYVHVLRTPMEVEQVAIERQRLWNNRKDDRGPFDIIGDVHGCLDELLKLLTALGYDADRSQHERVIPPHGRKAIFLGDLVDRGPDSLGVIELVQSMVARGDALCLPGNHDVKLMRKLRGKNVQLTHGLAETMAQIETLSAESQQDIADFIDSMIGHYVLDGGKLVVAHAGLKEQYIGRASRRVREFALYGDTTGETDEAGLPVRLNWAANYRGPAHIVYGHTPVAEADWLNRTINIDTGCVFGGKLTALRWPEREIVSVPANRQYAEAGRPFLPEEMPASAGPSLQQQHDDLLNLEDVLGKWVVTTRLMQNVTVREENATAALEVMSRFAIDPRWLIYLPPTMSPSETSEKEGFLEHPQEAFDYFRANDIAQVVCEEKHMGSRAVAIICREPQVVGKRFGIDTDSIGTIYTRTGRRFFDDGKLEAELLSSLHASITGAKFWERFESDWFCLDCELMPWSAKAQELLRTQYAAVGSGARMALPRVVDALRCAKDRTVDAQADLLSAMSSRFENRLTRADRYVAAYRQYCWPVNSVADLKLAPFHLLASENHVHVDRDHIWHMQTLAELASQSILATRTLQVDTADESSVQRGIEWWSELTQGGGEGMVVKPLNFCVRGKRGLAQPAVKCRGPEYLRIIYGPDYDAPENLARLRKRNLGAKRSLAQREFALGIEGLERFIRHEPLRRVHECVFSVLALESEPVDPRL
jgi:polynucleotide kinase-phosphatase